MLAWLSAGEVAPAPVAALAGTGDVPRPVRPGGASGPGIARPAAPAPALAPAPSTGLPAPPVPALAVLGLPVVRGRSPIPELSSEESFIPPIPAPAPEPADPCAPSLPSGVDGLANGEGRLRPRPSEAKLETGGRLGRGVAEALFAGPEAEVEVGADGGPSPLPGRWRPFEVDDERERECPLSNGADAAAWRGDMDVRGPPDAPGCRPPAPPLPAPPGAPLIRDATLPERCLPPVPDGPGAARSGWSRDDMVGGVEESAQ